MTKKNPDRMAWANKYKRQRPPSRSKNHAVQSYKQHSLARHDMVTFKRGPRRGKAFYVVRVSGLGVKLWQPTEDKYETIPPEKRHTIEVVFQPFRTSREDKILSFPHGGRFPGALN